MCSFRITPPRLSPRALKGMRALNATMIFYWGFNLVYGVYLFSVWRMIVVTPLLVLAIYGVRASHLSLVEARGEMPPPTTTEEHPMPEEPKTDEPPKRTELFYTVPVGWRPEREHFMRVSDERFWRVDPSGRVFGIQVKVPS